MTQSIEVREDDGVRTLHFGSHWIQGAMRVARPYALELEYTREMLFPLLLRGGGRWPRRVLQIGLGAASLTKFLYRHRPDAVQTVIEIDPAVVQAARQFFKLPDDAQRVNVSIGDGDAYVAASTASFDLVLVDAFDAKGRSGRVDQFPFYRNARLRLSEGGLLAVNYLTRGRGFAGRLERLAEAFDGRVCVLPASANGNVIALATADDRIECSWAELGASARALKRDTGLNLLPTLARLAQAEAGCGDSFAL